EGGECRVFAVMRLACRHDLQERVEQPLVGDKLRRDLGLEGSSDRADLEQQGLLQQRPGRRASEGREAVIISAGFDAFLDVAAAVTQDRIGGKLDVEVAAEQPKARLVAALVSEPAEQEAKTRLRYQDAVDRAREVRLFAPDQRIVVLIDAVLEIMIEAAG